MSGISYEILEGMVQFFGRCFHFKEPVASFMRAAGVKRELVDKYKSEPKFIWARKVITELGETEDGRLTQRRLLTEICKLRNLPDPGVEDRDSGLSALREIKKLALENDLVAKEEKENESFKSKREEEKKKLIRERSLKLRNLHQKFTQAIMNPDRQEAGFTLEDLLKELFALFEIDYKKSYKTETQQIDGHFNFCGFDYLVEAKWRKDQPPESEIGAFKRKVDTKLESTRGLFICGSREKRRQVASR